MTEVAPILTSLALLITPIAVAYFGVQQVRTRREVEKVHVQVNSNLAKVERELSLANRRWDQLIVGLGQHPDASRIFADLVAERNEELQ